MTFQWNVVDNNDVYTALRRITQFNVDCDVWRSTKHVLNFVLEKTVNVFVGKHQMLEECLKKRSNENAFVLMAAIVPNKSKLIRQFGCVADIVRTMERIVLMPWNWFQFTISRRPITSRRKRSGWKMYERSPLPFTRMLVFWWMKICHSAIFLPNQYSKNVDENKSVKHVE